MTSSKKFNVLGVIVGRKLSRRLSGKALRELDGLPLVGWTARAAAAAESLTDVIVSTDDLEIARAAKASGIQAPFERPEELANDNVGNDRVLKHALEWMTNRRGKVYQIVVLIQPTVPFLQPQDINGCVAKVGAAMAGCCFTAVQTKVNPEVTFRETEPGIAEAVIPGHWLNEDRKSHPIPPAYMPNGAVWAIWVETFLVGGQIYSAPMHLLTMPPERSIDIDYAHDLLIADAVRQAFEFVPTPRFGINTRAS